MAINKLKAFLIILVSVFTFLFFTKVFKSGLSFQEGQLAEIFFVGFFSSFFVFAFFNKPIVSCFDEKYYRTQDEINFQTNLRRELQRKRALSEIDNENLHYQNQLRIEYIAQVAQIHLQSNQYLANMYQQAIINNSTQNELTAQKQLLELEEELKKQGLI